MQNEKAALNEMPSLSDAIVRPDPCESLYRRPADPFDAPDVV